MKIEKQLITPQIAEQLLKNNSMNRRTKQPVIQRYTNEMLAGRWKSDTGELIKISKDGNILDGQHRLIAICKSGISLYFHIAYECDPEIFDVIDSGSLRNTTDAFHVKGIKHDNIIPSIISTYYSLREGRSRNTQVHFKPTTTVILDEYYKNEDYWQDVARNSVNWYKSFAKILPPSMIGGMYAYLMNINKDDALSFMIQLTEGVDACNTINLLRRKLVQDKVSIRKMSYRLRVALIIKAWNYFRNDEKIKILKFDQERESMPIAI